MKIFKLLTLFALFVSLCALSISAQKLKPEEILAKHLESIGTSEARAAVKSMMAVGEGTVSFVTQKNQSAQGRIVLASSGEKTFWGLALNAADYPWEKFSFDGSKAKVAFVRAGQRSILGNFVLTNDKLLDDGLLGGTLATSWAMLRLDENKGKISGDGSKKIEGRECYAISYTSKSGGDVDVKFYFDKENFRHLRTEYTRISSAGIGTNPNQSSGLRESRIKLTEDFSDYKAEKGLMLPHAYRVFYSISGQSQTTEIEWKFVLTEFAFNPKLDDATFDAEAK